jgi:hypothetical protein
MNHPESVGSLARQGWHLAMLLAVGCLSPLWPSAARADSLSKQASWQVPTQDQVISRVRQSLQTHGVSPDQIDVTLQALHSAIQEADGDVLNAFINASALSLPVIDRVRELAEQNPLAGVEWLSSADPLAATFDQLPTDVLASTRTWLARELVQARMFDEALPLFADVEHQNSLDPAAVLFYRGVCRYSLLQKKDALADLRKLLENEGEIPVRFVRTAQLMVADLKPLEEDSLDEVSRLMTDVTRRLDLGRANSDVEQREQTIIDKLTKLIEEMEEQQKQQQQQQQQQQQGGSGQAQGGSQGSPMNDSQAAGASGQGDVDKKNINQRGGWGNLPPAQREEALQQISRDLPTHYREAIEAYFRKLATGG